MSRVCAALGNGNGWRLIIITVLLAYMATIMALVHDGKVQAQQGDQQLNMRVDNLEKTIGTRLETMGTDLTRVRTIIEEQQRREALGKGR